MSALVLAAFLAVALIWIPQMPGVQRHAPWRASEALDRLPGRARVLNEYVLGGWLLWTARDVSPAIDGRTEIYQPDYVGQAMAATHMGPGWRRFVERHHFDAAILSNDSQLVFGLKTLGWRVAFRDSSRVILVPPAV